MRFAIDMGVDDSGAPAAMDLEELLSTRLLVQGNSGSGKSHLLRRMLEGSAGQVQQIVIDPEGDFVTLSDAFGHVAIEAADYSLAEIAGIAGRIREHRASVVLSLEGLEMDGQMRCAAAFLSALFEAPRDFWYPALVVVDEAQVFAPAAAGEVSDEARRASLGAMTNLMCRGRKRGLAGVIATQRLAKLAKNVAAEASNFLMGRTFLDIDMARAADLLGMERRQAEAIRDLERGQFLALGPALSRRPVKVRIGAVKTGTKGAGPKLVPLPEAPPEDLESLLLTVPEGEAPPPPPPPPAPRPVPSEALIERAAARAPAPVPDEPEFGAEEREAIVAEALAATAAEPGSAFQPEAVLYQDFLVRCRMRRLGHGAPALPEFRRRLAFARAGIAGEEGYKEAIALAESLPEDMHAPFLALAKAARHEEPAPSDAALAEIYGTQSPARIRRLLAFIEEKGLIATRTDLAGNRSVALPHLGWTTAPALPDPQRPPRLARVAEREARRRA